MTLIITDYVQGNDPMGQSTEDELRLFPQGQVTVRYPVARPDRLRSASYRSPRRRCWRIRTTYRTRTVRISTEPDQPVPCQPLPRVDRLDSGTRVTYGVNTGVYGFGGGFSEFFLGQSYQLSNNDDPALVASGLGQDYSDIVGRIRVSPGPYLDLQYDFQLAEEDLEPQVQQFRVSAGVPILVGPITITAIGRPRVTPRPGASI